MALLGTGSVSSYVVDHAPMRVAVVRQNVPLETALQVRQVSGLNPEPGPSHRAQFFPHDFPPNMRNREGDPKVNEDT